MRPSSDPHSLIAALARDRVSIDVNTADLCFLAALHLQADRASLASFEEDQLVDLFVQVCDVVEPAAENPRKRATHAIQRLRDQRMLTRVDGNGLVRAGEYTLTRLAAGLVEYFATDEALTRQSLTLLTASLRVQLAEVLAAARKATTAEDWIEGVVAPLGVTVAELVAGIERRQRGLDAQQEDLQDQIARLIDEDWFHAIERCQSLLDTTTTTLGELNEVLLRETGHFLALLQDVQGLAAEAGQPEAEEAAGRVTEHVDRIAGWGRARQRAWSDYYQYIHRFVRDVVRLDPERALSQRLRDQIAGWSDRPFALVTAAAPAIRLLRPLEARVERPPVIRPKADREAALELVAPADDAARLEDLVADALAAGARTLAEVTAAVLPAVPEEGRYAAAGVIADAVVRLATARSARERPWTVVIDRLEIEDWTVNRREPT